MIRVCGRLIHHYAHHVSLTRNLAYLKAAFKKALIYENIFVVLSAILHFHIIFDFNICIQMLILLILKICYLLARRFKYILLC